MTGPSGNDLQDAHLFAGLAAAELDAVAASGTVHIFPVNTVVLRRGESSSSLYVILSGRVKVYVDDDQGNQILLNERRAGDHIGEIAMLGDSVRTASVITLEETKFLVLARRPFMQCLARNPQIAVNLDEGFIEHCMAAEFGRESAARFRAWSIFRRSGIPLILLIGGCTGTGKSTIAAEVSLRLDIGRTQSTDLLREVMRVLIPKQSDAVLHSSTYEAWRALDDESFSHYQTGSKPVAGFYAQAERLAAAVDGVITRSIEEQTSAIIEGIHAHPAYHRRWSSVDAIVVPVLLTVPSRNELQNHFLRRGDQAPSRGSRRYLDGLEIIWQMQEQFIAEAKDYGVAIVPNIHFNRTVDDVLAVITSRLLARFVSDNAETSHGR